LPGLVNLNLGNNPITEIEAAAFDCLINLRVLKLNYIKLRTFYFNVFESEANEIGPLVNLRYLSLNSSSIELLEWSPETAILEEENMPAAKKKKIQEADAAARLFAKCGFRNKVDIILKRCWNEKNKLAESPYLNELALRDLVRLSYFF
jgi:Leucine-rich repeat (LRR) protein